MAVTDSVAVENSAAATDAPPVRRWAKARRWTTTAYFVVLVTSIAIAGIPEGRESLLLWVLAGLGTRCIGTSWRRFGRVLIDWIPFTAVLVAYDYSRGVADNLGFEAHVKLPVHIDEWLFHGTLPTVWLQHLYDPAAARWYDGVITLIYTSHFVLMPVAAVILYVRNRSEWKVFIGRIIGLSLAGLATYIVVPWAPPWYASQQGVIDPIIRLSSRGFQVLHLNHASTLLTNGQAAVNDVAAMPSLHAATATVIALYFIPKVRWWWRIPLACYPLAMGFALVYSGEHYVIDLIVGYAYGILVTLISVYVQRRLAARRAAKEAAAEDATEVPAEWLAENQPAVAGTNHSSSTSSSGSNADRGAR
jgi:membrane-associated phospholipid phosphatase